MTRPENPRIDGLSARFTHLEAEDPPWIAVRSQTNRDGSESHVWERWIAFSTEPLYLALFARWDPGMIVRRHGHHSPHTLLVLEGNVSCDGAECGPGTHIELPHGASFGPFVAGPDGLVAYEVMMGDPRSWSDEPEAMAAVLAEHGVTPLPDPPIELPAGLEDLRAVFSAGAGPATDATD
ncbi:MAG TPA: hypothetical protein VFP02_09140 [Acidimicrobiales bacterium]|nr:hypothetical protein [Acidimicrobiales bacterium]